MKIVICTDMKEIVDLVDNLYTGFKVEDNKIIMDNVINNDKFEILRETLKKKNIKYAIKEDAVCKSFKSEIFDKNNRRYDVSVNYEGKLITYCIRHEDTNEIVGGAICNTYCRSLDAYVVHDDYRGLGIGNSIVRKILKDNPTTITSAICDSRNLPSLQVLTKHGFVICGMVQDTSDPTVHFLHMNRDTNAHERYAISSGANLTAELLGDMDYM